MSTLLKSTNSKSAGQFVRRLQTTLVLLTTLLLVLPASAEDSIEFTMPKGWRQEKIKLPPPFAKNMQLKGLEDLWFSPGMFSKDSDSFFSYVFVFIVDGSDVFSEKVIQQEILIYYQGLAKAVARDAEVDVSKFEFKLEKSKKIGSTPKNAKDVVQYSASLKWLEPFVTKKSQELKLEIQSFSIPGTEKSYLFVSASPQPAEAKIWETMREIRKSLVNK